MDPIYAPAVAGLFLVLVAWWTDRALPLHRRLCHGHALPMTLCPTRSKCRRRALYSAIGWWFIERAGRLGA